MIGGTVPIIVLPLGSLVIRTSSQAEERRLGSHANPEIRIDGRELITLFIEIYIITSGCSCDMALLVCIAAALCGSLMICITQRDEVARCSRTVVD